MTGYSILGAVASDRSSDDAAIIPSTPRPIPHESAARAVAVAAMKSLVGTPYVWASKDVSKGGLDCSGAVTVAYEKAGLALPGARYRYGSADLHRALEPTRSPEPADLAFYGRSGKVSHVMMYVGDGNVAGASGGGPRTKTADDARAIGAYVKTRPADYRKDLVGYGRAPSTPLAGSKTRIVRTSDTRWSLAEWVTTIATIAGVGVAGYYGIEWWRNSR